MARISYRCLPEERSIPIAMRTRWNVYLGDQQVGSIFVVDGVASRVSQNLRIWKAKLYGDVFDPFEFPHMDEDDDFGRVSEPFVITNDDPDTDHNLELVSPSLMTMAEARTWVRSIFKDARSSQ